MKSRRLSPARKHKATPSRPKRILAPGLCLVFLLSGCGLLAGTPTTSSPPPPTSPYNRFISTEQKAFDTALSSLHGVSVPKKPGALAPSLPAGAFGSGLGSHVVLGFLPSWEIYSASS